MNYNQKCMVFFSGGLCSYLAAKRCVEMFGADDVLLYFTDTSYEHETLYKFIDAAADRLGCTIVKESLEKTPFDVFNDVKMMGNTRLDPCSRILKRELSHSFVDNDFTGDTLCLGFDFTESKRIDNAVKNWPNHDVICPMSDPPYLTRQMMIEETQADGLDIPYLYKIGMAHNNCSGFCVKAGQGHYASLLKQNRQLYLQHEQKEAECYERIGKKYPFLRMTVKGEIKYVTLKQFREHLDGNGQCDMFDIGGCGCFSEG